MVVIIGVTIAFAISNHADYLKGQAEKKTILQAMLKEIENDIDIYENHQIPANIENKRWTDGLIEIVGSGVEKESDSISQYFQNGIFRFNNWRISDATYISIKSTGKIDLIEDYVLKMEIITLYEARAGQSNFIIDQSLNRLNKMWDYLDKKIDLQKVETYSTVFDDLEFRNYLTKISHAKRAKISEFEGNVEALHHVKGLIEKHLGASNQ